MKVLPTLYCGGARGNKAASSYSTVISRVMKLKNRLIYMVIVVIGFYGA